MLVKVEVCSGLFGDVFWDFRKFDMLRVLFASPLLLLLHTVRESLVVCTSCAYADHLVDDEVGPIDVHDHVDCDREEELRDEGLVPDRGAGLHEKSRVHERESGIPNCQELEDRSAEDERHSNHKGVKRLSAVPSLDLMEEHHPPEGDENCGNLQPQHCTAKHNGQVERNQCTVHCLEAQKVVDEAEDVQLCRTPFRSTKR
jgi:hypothetical protein